MTSVLTDSGTIQGQVIDNDLHRHQVKIYKARLDSRRVVDQRDEQALWRHAAEAAADRHPRWARQASGTLLPHAPETFQDPSGRLG